MVLILRHARADTERGFSVNKNAVFHNMYIETLRGDRNVNDTIKHAYELRSS